jgi:hypothetical protein
MTIIGIWADMASEIGHVFRHFFTYLLNALRRRGSSLLASKSLEKAAHAVMDFPGMEGGSSETLEKIAGCSENDYKNDKAGNIPLPRTPLVWPVQHGVEETSDQAAVLLFFMISETNLTAAGRIVTTKITRMYFAGSSFPRYAMIKYRGKRPTNAAATYLEKE